MKVTQTKFPEVLLIEPDVFEDKRGFFFESWNSEKYSNYGVDNGFVQDNFSFSRYGVLRGLHFQNPQPQGKLVSVLQGEVYDVVVDIRIGSPTFGEWFGITLSETNKSQLFIPAGFAHGFVATSEYSLFHYKCTSHYSPENEASILWNDPDLSIKWPINEPVVSKKDLQAPLLKDISEHKLFRYKI